ncbi:MAG: hypothetical protein WAQ28_09240 [Bacteroidia bacterium]|jgi:phage shock protein PspC (stress-responsive transcriptional regulator)
MNWTDIFNGIGDFFQWTFKFITVFKNAPNIFFWLLIAVLTVVWLRMQAKYNKEAEKNNTLK